MRTIRAKQSSGRFLWATRYCIGCICVCVAVVVYLVLYGIYVLVVVLGRIVYQYQKRQAAQNNQQSSVNRVNADGDDFGRSLLYS